MAWWKSLAGLACFTPLMCKGRIPVWYMPIGTDSGGNIYIMSLHPDNKEIIALWWHEDEADENGSKYFGNLTAIANLFAEFLELLEERIS